MVHPAALPLAALLKQCEIRRQRRSGPGGQHRNKVETAVVITHQPTGIRGEASERRSQDLNRAMAVQRLRVKLALAIRSPAPVGDVAAAQCSALWRSRLHGRQLHVSPAHADFPALLAEALDRLATCDFDCKLAADQLACTPSQLVKLLKLEAEALQQVNVARAARSLAVLL
jgi:hypothetical protein